MLLYSFLVNPLGHDLSAYMSWWHENAHSGRSLFWGRASFPLATRVGRSGLASWSPLSRWYCGDLKVVYSWTVFASAKLTWPWKLKAIFSLAGLLKKSDSMLILWDPSWTERLWCLFELAAFLQSKKDLKKELIIRPTFLGPVHIAVFLTCVAGMIPLTMAPIDVSNGAIAFVVPAIFMCLSGFVVFYVAMSTLRRYFRDLDIMKQQLLSISFDTARSSCCDTNHVGASGAPVICDRRIVQECVNVWFGSQETRWRFQYLHCDFPECGAKGSRFLGGLGMSGCSLVCVVCHGVLSRLVSAQVVLQIADAGESCGLEAESCSPTMKKVRSHFCRFWIGELFTENIPVIFDSFQLSGRGDLFINNVKVAKSVTFGGFGKLWDVPWHRGKVQVSWSPTMGKVAKRITFGDLEAVRTFTAHRRWGSCKNCRLWRVLDAVKCSLPMGKSKDLL